jgi:hypothetical protein
VLTIKGIIKANTKKLIYNFFSVNAMLRDDFLF